MQDTEISDYEEWCEVNETEINCILAESGADRERDFNYEKETLYMWEHPKKYPTLRYPLNRLLDNYKLNKDLT